MSTKRLQERTAAPFAGAKVNREEGTIDGVLVCGFTSENGRDYPAAVFQRDHKLYEGKPTNCDHSEDSTVDRRFGWLSEVTLGSDGRPRARLNCLKSHPIYERLMEAAERRPELFGFSHVIQAETKQKDGREVVEAIKQVVSIDLVADPATTKSLFEGRTVNRISLKQFGEKYGPKWGPKRWGAFAKLCEEMGDMAAAPVMDAPAEEPADAAPEGDMKAALLAALAPMLDEAFDSGDSTKVVSALKDFIKLHAKHTGNGDSGGGESAGDSSGGESEEKKDESKKRKWLAHVRALREECRKAGVNEPSDSLLLYLDGETNQAARAETLKGLTESRGGAETPTSGGRGAIQDAANKDAKRIAEEKAAAGKGRIGWD